MIESLVYVVLYIVVVGLIVGLLLWLVDNVIPIQEPFHRVARAVIIVAGVLIVIVLLLSLISAGAPHLKLGDAAWLMRA